ncbi:MAG: tetratricopeptide repeat protein, partial [candidate division WOR-3 bacterium]
KRHKGYAEILKMSIETPKISTDEFTTHLNLAINYRFKGLFNEAIKEFEACLKLQPQNGKVYNYLGEALILANRYQDAVQILTEGFKYSPDSVEIANALGVVYHLLNQRKECITWYKKAISLNRDYGPTLNNIAVRLLKENKPNEALDYFERAQKNNNFDANYNLGYIALARGDFEKAQKLFSGETIEDLLGQGLVALSLGRDEEAINYFKKVLSIAPNNAAAYYNLGLAYTKIGNFDQSIEYIKKGIEIDPKYEKERYRLSLSNELVEFGIYVSAKMDQESIVEARVVEEAIQEIEIETSEKIYERALESFRKMELEKAEEAIDELFKLDENHLGGRILKARILNLTGESEEAIFYLDKIINTEAPDNIEALELAGEIYLKEHNFEKALPVFSRLANLQPENIRNSITLGNIKYELNQLDEALNYYQQVKQRDPDNIDANLGMARIYLRKEKLDETENILASINEKYAGNYDLHILNGLFLIKKKDYINAVKQLTRAISIDPSKSLPYYHLGLIYAQRGQFDDACNAWKKGLLLNPEKDLATKIRNCLEVTIELEELLKKGEQVA